MSTNTASNTIPMNKKEVNELRRRWKPDKNAVSRLYGCFVNSNREIVADLDESLGLMPQEEAEKYLNLLKKVLSGALGKNLLDIVFTTEQVTEGAEHKLLMELKNSELKDSHARQGFYQKVIQSMDMGESSYLLLMASDRYDVPQKNSDIMGSSDADEVFSYFLCAVCPVKTEKTELGYFSGDNEFHCSANQVVGAPEFGFLFPTFDDRSANIYNALFYSRKADELHHEFIDAVFHTDPPMPAAEQREAFEGALAEALGDSFDLDIIRAVHEQLTAKIEEHLETKNPEPLCGERFGSGAVLNPANLIDAKKAELKTERFSVSIDPEYSYLLETKVLDGRKVLIIPVEDHVEFNGVAVAVDADKE